MEKEEIRDQVKDVLREVMDEDLKGQLKEYAQDAVKSLNEQQKALIPEEEQKKADEKAKSFKTFGEFIKTVWVSKKSGKLDPRLHYVGEKATTGHMEIGEDSYGGFLVPEIYRNELLQHVLESAVVRPRATIIPMTTDSLKIPYNDETSHASHLFGGVIAYWTAEAAAKTASSAKFGQLELTPHKLAGITYSSNELLADSAIALEPLIKRQFADAWGFTEDYAFLRGVGAGQPLGILNCGCLKSVYRNTSSTVKIEDLAEMYQSMLPSSLSKAVWVINPTVIAELIELSSSNAADGNSRNLIWINNAHEAPNWTILGRPVIITEKLPELGTAGDILFADFSYYLIGDRQPITIDASTHIRFDYDETAWRFVLRVAGQCWPQNKLTIKSGTHTYSPFVVLNANSS